MNITIIGQGMVGKSLYEFLRKRNFTVELKPARQSHASGSISGIALLTVPDDAIENVCSKLVAEQAFVKGTIVAHCSGSLNSTALNSATIKNLNVGSLHPLQTFPSVEAGVKGLERCYFFCEGDEISLPVLLELGSRIGMGAFKVKPEKKVFYHLAAVSACNYLSVLMEASQELAEMAELDRSAFWNAVLPMVEQTLSNISAIGAVAALTGSIARGDAQVINRHRNALIQHGDLLSLYDSSGVLAVAMALSKGTINSNAAAKLLGILTEK